MQDVVLALLAKEPAQRAGLAEPDGSHGALLVEGLVLRLEADLRWLEACERRWSTRGDHA